MPSYRDGRIELIVGDITKLAVDAIVNAANAALSGGGGVDGAIHRAAGRELLLACRTLGRCPTGEARITRGYDLPARYVIHAVGPVWQGGSADERALLASAYRKSLQLARDAELATIAFPSISTGAYRFPIKSAAAIAVREAIAHFENPTSLTCVTFCCFNEDDAAVYRTILDAN